jgi:hypothetical protein
MTDAFSVDRFGRVQRAPERAGLRPRETNSSMPVVFSASNTGRCAKIDLLDSGPQALFALIEGIGLQPNNVLAILPQTGGPINAAVPFGGVAAVGKLVFGDGGVSQDFIFNISPGAVAKVPFVGSSGDFGPILVPKYYKKRETVDGPVTRRTYISDVANDLDIDNPTFNQPGKTGLLNALTNAGVPIGAQDNVFNTAYTALARGWFGSGSSTSQDDTRPVRKFFASLAAGTAGTKATRVPIAWNATAVKISGSPLLTFNQLSLGASADAERGVLGAFAANQFVPMQENVEFIDVTAASDTAGETFFEVIYSFGT